MSDCPLLNRSPLTRNHVLDCDYHLMEDHLFFRMLQANCTYRAACQFDTFNELFRDGGTCGSSSNALIDIRNWVHIEYQCFGNGAPCEPLYEETTIPPKFLAPTAPAVGNLSLNMTSHHTAKIFNTDTSEKPAKAPTKRVDRVGNIIIPIVTATISVIILLVVACILYRSKACKKKHYRESRQAKPHQANITLKNGNVNHSFKIDADRLHELKSRISDTEDQKSGGETVTLPDRRSPTRNKLQNRKSCGCSESKSPSVDQSHDRYLSDSSTTDVEEIERHRRWIKPFPPLPKPKIKHSEVYFTETETENESCHGKIQPFVPSIVERKKEDGLASSTCH